MTEAFFTVGELARELGVTARALRFYEDRGLLSPRRAGANRIYTQRDRARMILILRGKRMGFSLTEIGEYLDLYEVDHTQTEQIRRLHDAVRARIDMLEQQREALELTLTELREVERQAAAGLATKSGAVRKTIRAAVEPHSPSSASQTRRRLRAAE